MQQLSMVNVRNGELDLSSRRLRSLPTEYLVSAKKAKTLSLSKNQLTSSGLKNILQLTQIVKLDLSQNQIESLPDNFGSLTLLVHLDLHSNKLRNLPISFVRLKKLKWLDLKENPLQQNLKQVAGPCLSDQQCQDCARRVLALITKLYEQICEDSLRIHNLEKTMAEKAAGKKDNQQQQQQQQQQKNKKAKQNDKKKNQENGVKLVNKQQPQKKKDKGNKHNNKSMSKKKPGTTRSVFRLLLTQGLFIFLIVGFLYIVDYDKYLKIRDGAGVYLNKTVSLLPPAVVNKGREALEVVRPAVELTFGQLTRVANQTSTFLNSNPLVKDHWSNIREISSISGARLVDYMRTLYLQVTGYCHDVKSKIFQ